MVMLMLFSLHSSKEDRVMISACVTKIIFRLSAIGKASEEVRVHSFRRSDDHLPFFFRALKVDLRNYRLHRTQDYRLMY
jgi:hypothetical protein